MSIGFSSLRIIGIEQAKKNKFNGKQDTALKPWRMTHHLWKMQYNRNRQAGTYRSSYMNCYVFCFYCVLFIIIDIDFCNFFINYDS